MIARSTPIAIKTKPDPPEDDAERLRKLAAMTRRHLGAVDAQRRNLEAIAAAAEEMADIIDRNEARLAS
jgi:hypothetical protein